MRDAPVGQPDISAGMVGLLALACGLIVTLTQAGYCLGLLFIVPLGDLLESVAKRRARFGAGRLGVCKLRMERRAGRRHVFPAREPGVFFA